MRYSLKYLNRARLAGIMEIKNWYNTPQKQEAANLLIQKDILCFKGQEPVTFQPAHGAGVLLARLCLRSRWVDKNRLRSLDRLIHGQEFIDLLMTSYHETKEQKYLNKACSLVEDYCRSISYTLHKNTFAFHDETTALRMENWILFLGLGIGELAERQIDLVLKNMGKSLRLLAKDSFFAGHNNHGMYQSLALLKGASLFDHEEARSFAKKAMERLNNYYLGAFTEEGVHNENSPQYHVMVMYGLRNYLEILKSLGLEKPDVLVSLYNKAMDYMHRITRIDGSCLPLGDTSNGYHLKTTYLASQINDLVAKDKPFVVYPASGYAFFYDDKRKMNAAFTSSYIHNYHKHNDDLQLVVDLGNKPLLIDPGNPSFEYKYPIVVYGRSTRAHNTLTVDDIEPFRTLDRIVENGRQTSLISDFRTEAGSAWAKGENHRVKGVEHVRTVTYTWKTGVFLVADQITSSEKHLYTFNWHFNEELFIEVQGNVLSIARDGEAVAQMSILADADMTIKMCSGQLEPHIQGFAFDDAMKPYPCPTVEVIFPAAKDLCVEWEIRM